MCSCRTLEFERRKWGSRKSVSKTFLMKANLLLWRKSIRLYTLSGLEEWSQSFPYKLLKTDFWMKWVLSWKQRRVWETLKKGSTMSTPLLRQVQNHVPSHLSTLCRMRGIMVFIVAFLCSVCHVSGVESPWLWFLCSEGKWIPNCISKNEAVSLWLGRPSFCGFGESIPLLLPSGKWSVSVVSWDGVGGTASGPQRERRALALLKKP